MLPIASTSFVDVNKLNLRGDWSRCIGWVRFPLPKSRYVSDGWGYFSLWIESPKKWLTVLFRPTRQKLLQFPLSLIPTWELKKKPTRLLRRAVEDRTTHTNCSFSDPFSDDISERERGTRRRVVQTMHDFCKRTRKRKENRKRWVGKALSWINPLLPFPLSLCTGSLHVFF